MPALPGTLFFHSFLLLFTVFLPPSISTLYLFLLPFSSLMIFPFLSSLLRPFLFYCSPWLFHFILAFIPSLSLFLHLFPFSISSPSPSLPSTLFSFFSLPIYYFILCLLPFAPYSLFRFPFSFSIFSITHLPLCSQCIFIFFSSSGSFPLSPSPPVYLLPFSFFAFLGLSSSSTFLSLHPPK